MRIAYDASCLAVKTKSGIEHMTLGLLRGMKELTQHEYFIYCYSSNDIPVDLPANFTVVPITRPNGFAGGLRWYWSVAQDIRSKKLDFFISTYTFSASLFTKSIQIVPDISPLTLPALFPAKHRLVYRFTLALAMRFAWRTATISNAVAQQLREYYGLSNKQITVFPMALDEWAASPLTPLLVQERETEGRVRQPYFLSISTVQPRKNYVNMIKAFAQFAKDNPNYVYKIVGKTGWYADKIYALVKELKLEQKVQFLGYAPDEELIKLMDGAAGFLYASFEEGFGIPVIDAAYRGVPILTSDLPVFHEIVTDNEAVFVDPYSVQSIYEGLNKLTVPDACPAARRGRQEAESLKLKTSGFRKEYAEKYNWKRAAESLIDSVRL